LRIFAKSCTPERGSLRSIAGKIENLYEYIGVCWVYVADVVGVERARNCGEHCAGGEGDYFGQRDDWFCKIGCPVKTDFLEAIFYTNHKTFIGQQCWLTYYTFRIIFQKIQCNQLKSS